MPKRVKLMVAGRVQGVGFRPSVYRLAQSCGLTGFVRNTPTGVWIEFEGPPAAVDQGVHTLPVAAPRQARIETLTCEEIPAVGDTRFEIAPSRRSGDLLAGFPPDLATCTDCVHDILDPANRRYAYPFTNCTNCGPRFTIICDLPYDRAHTSMAAFQLCPACRTEYLDPGDRRFDAQPNACPVCGPRLTLLGAGGQPVDTPDPLAGAIQWLRDGRILAVKSLGGYHLCCDAANPDAIARLRARKRRPAKPLAVMFYSLAEISRHCELSPEAAAELQAPPAPIVILPRRPDSPLPALLSPDTPDLGVLVPFTPLHYLLLAHISPLVMTSGNRRDEPVAKDETELAALLGAVADGALSHNRPILRRCDDSVVKIQAGQRVLLRRSRGFVPDPILLPQSGPPVLACGADLKNAFCVTRGHHAFLSQHIGDLEEFTAYRFLAEAATDLTRLLQVQPEAVVCDLHPGYASTRFARNWPAPQHLQVQHHHAHIAAVMAEHRLTEPVLGVALDGTGYGPDGTVWGGEFLVADLRGFRRVGHLATYRLPGADTAITQPARMGLSLLLAEFGETAGLAIARQRLPTLTGQELEWLVQMIRTGVNSPWTSSAGRLFDAVAALVGFADPVSYEGQAAIRLQSLAESATAPAPPYPYMLMTEAEPFRLSFGPMLPELLEELRRGVEPRRIARRFHHTVAAGTVALCDALAAREKLRVVALSGGVFQNDLLLRLLEAELGRRGFRVLCHREAPPNDACIALGQAAIALARLQA